MMTAQEILDSINTDRIEQEIKDRRDMDGMARAAVSSTDWLARDLAKGVHDHAFAEVPAGTLLTEEVVKALWDEHTKIGRKLTVAESEQVIQRANGELTGDSERNVGKAGT